MLRSGQMLLWSTRNYIISRLAKLTMFGIFTKRLTIEESGLMRGLNDHHTHILPAVDDGLRTLEESLAVLEYYESMGVKRVVCTPHIMEDFKNNNPIFLRSKFDEFKSTYIGTIELSLAAEYMLDSQFLKHLASKDLLTLKDNYLLVETSCFDSVNNLLQIIDQTMSNGYFVVLAHPERYEYMELKEYTALKRRRVLFQLNLLSLAGIYGPHAESAAKMLLDKNYYNMVGCDIHSLSYHKRYITERKIEKKYLDKIIEINKNGEF